MKTDLRVREIWVGGAGGEDLPPPDFEK